MTFSLTDGLLLQKGLEKWSNAVEIRVMKQPLGLAICEMFALEK